MFLKKYRIVFLCVFAINFIACKSDKKVDHTTQSEPLITENNKEVKVSVKLNPVGGSEAKGSAIFNEVDGEMRMVALVSYLTEGNHQMYILEANECAETLDNENLHWNPLNKSHGLWGNENGYHKGDIGLIKADNLGNATLNFKTSEWCIDCNDPSKDILGKTLVVVSNINENKINKILSCGKIIKN